MLMLIDADADVLTGTDDIEKDQGQLLTSEQCGIICDDVFVESSKL